MEYRGFHFSVVQSVAPKGWRWIVQADAAEKAGISINRDMAIRSAQKFIDALIRLGKGATPPQSEET